MTSENSRRRSGTALEKTRKMPGDLKTAESIPGYSPRISSAPETSKGSATQPDFMPAASPVAFNSWKDITYPTSTENCYSNGQATANMASFSPYCTGTWPSPGKKSKKTFWWARVRGPGSRAAKSWGSRAQDDEKR